ncbi:hypothetical protein DL93DRAFT_2164502 [Clavulina sp. PMI_390]|nr:hypothetical protein DL93DRAFT_2164502 [Clavulina sp. PMI_390]
MTGIPPPLAGASSLGLSSSVAGSLGLPLAFTLPPTPHPNVIKDIEIIAAKTGVLISSASKTHPVVYVHIGYGNPPTLAELPSVSLVESEVDRSSACTIAGVLGIVNLFQRSYLLVISSRVPVTEYFGRTIYAIKTVIPIPLESITTARLALKTVQAKSSFKPSIHKTPSQHTGDQSDTSADLSDAVSDDGIISLLPQTEEPILLDPVAALAQPAPSSAEVSEDLNTIEATPETLPSSDPAASIPSTSVESSGVKRFARRLVFWNRRSQPATALPEVPIPPASLESESPNPPLPPISEPMKMPIPASAILPTDTSESVISDTPPIKQQSQGIKRSELEQKILREAVSLYCHQMYFAYDCDITTPIQRKADRIRDLRQATTLLKDLTESPRFGLEDEQLGNSSKAIPWDASAEPELHLPLWRRVDRRFWWNEHMVQGFINAGFHDFVLPVVQGYVQTASFPLTIPGLVDPVVGGDESQDTVSEDVEVEYTIISRRSRQRAGLRYQRRGIDEDAHVANFVETETITCVQLHGVPNVFSHVQIRGSIPIFWSQPGMNLKPVPKLDRTPSESQLAMKNHFDRSIRVYGPHTIVNLSEVTGKEAAVTNAYHDQVVELNRPDIKYEGFDFHHECKGMRYENISKLIDSLARDFERQGFFWASGSKVLSQQNGVFRVNCIDCLDRTNVVESAFARHILLQQLSACALEVTPRERKALEIVFNDVWANNGDAISRVYAGTSALKGDYTRTGRRDITGMLNDGMNSLARNIAAHDSRSLAPSHVQLCFLNHAASRLCLGWDRMYTATFTDYFSQAVIDFALGHRSISVFSEFMLNMSATDPRELFRLSKIRAIAIETCSKLVVLEDEEVRAGWTLFSPTKVNVRVADVFEEKVVLLTSEALYIVSYDYVLEKVRVVTRVPNINIVSIQKGAYILSPLQDAGRDVSQNYGFMVGYRSLDKVVTRVTSYSIHNLATAPPASRGSDEVGGDRFESGISAALSGLEGEGDPLRRVNLKKPPFFSTGSAMTIRPARNQDELSGTSAQSTISSPLSSTLVSTSPAAPTSTNQLISGAGTAAPGRQASEASISISNDGNQADPAYSVKTKPPRPQPSSSTKKRSLSAFLTSTVPKGVGEDDVVYVAFKALPVDHTIKDRDGSSGFTQPRHSERPPFDHHRHHENNDQRSRSSVDLNERIAIGRGLQVDMSCREVVDEICAQLVEACEQVGLKRSQLVVEKDIIR